MALNQWCLRWLTFAQDIIGLPKLTHLTFQILNPITFGTGGAIARATVTFHLPNPDLLRLWDTANFWGNRSDRR